jgi:hypothetical protein
MIRLTLILWACLAAALNGCYSLQRAGNADYSLKPIKIDGETICCELKVNNGKEIESLKVHVEKNGDHFTFDLEEKGVKAFKGQAISAEAIPGITTTIPMLLPQ